MSGEGTVRGPEMGEFQVAEAGADAGVAVMHGDRAATDRPKEAGGDYRWKPAARFTGDESAAALRAGCEDSPQGWIVQVMQEKVGENEVEGFATLLKPLVEIGGHKFRRPAEIAEGVQGGCSNCGLHVEQGDATARSGALDAMEEIESESSVSRPDFENGLRRTGENGDGACDVSLVAHPPVKALQIAAGAERFRIVRGELIENLRLYNAVHWSPANIEKRAVATDSRAERGKEPCAAGSFCGDGFLESEKDTRTADVAVFAQNLGAPIKLIGGDVEA